MLGVRFIDRETFYKFSKFLLGGGLGYIINIVSTYVLTEFFGLYYLLSYTISFSVVILFHFFFNTYIIFKLEKEHFKRFFYYLFSVLFFTVSNIFLVKVFTEYLKLYYLFSIIIVTASLFLLKFFIYKDYVFKNE